MSVNVSFRRIALVMVPAMLGLSWPVSAAQVGKFQASGTFAVISAQGANITVSNTGHASPGGPFTGTFEGKQAPGSGNVRGVTTWDFGGGDTLTFDNVLEVDPETGLLVGTYVITSGTGKLARATGSGSFIVAPAGDGTGTFELAGTLSH